MTTTDTSVESQPFQAEVSELLHLMVHSVYSETDIFLRELISNASDACDKLRYEAIARPELITDGEPPKISIVPDKKDDTLVVADSGIGMDRQEPADHQRVLSHRRQPRARPRTGAAVVAAQSRRQDQADSGDQPAPSIGGRDRQGRGWIGDNG